MLDSTATTTAILSRLADANDESIWNQFDGRYRPILLGVLQRLGLQPEDARDLTQEALLQFFKEHQSGRYQRERGTIRSWLTTIARNRATDLHRRRQNMAGARGHSLLGELPGADAFDEAFEAESREHVLCRALDLLRERSEFRPETVRAFERYALEGQRPEDVAKELGLTVRAVYMAKHHCVTRLMELSKELRDAYEID